MVDTQKMPWKRIGVEASAIVVSILLAFAIDAWWEERGDRQTERDDLARLHAEFVSNRDRISENGVSPRALAASENLYQLFVAHLGQNEPLDVQNVQLRSVKATPTFDAVTPVLDGLISSGRLENIRNREVLLAISWWRRMIQQVEETEIGARQFVSTQLAPALVERGNMGQVFSTVDLEGTVDDGVTSVIVDQKLVGLVAQRVNDTKFVMMALDGLETAANSVVVAVEKAQGD